MDVNAIAAASSEMSQSQTAQAVQVAVFNKALDFEAQSANQLVQALPTNPLHLGNNLDIYA